MVEEKAVSCGGEIGDLKCKKHGRMVGALKMKGAYGRMQERLREDKPATKLSARASRIYFLPIT